MKGCWFQVLSAMSIDSYQKNQVSAMIRTESVADKRVRLSLWLVVSYMFFEFVRPQSFVPGLAALHIPMLIQIAIALALLRCNFSNLKSREGKLFLLLLCLMVFHMPFATNNYKVYVITRMMILHFVVFLGIVGFIRSQRDYDLVITFWIVIAILSGAKGYLEGGLIRGFSFLNDENDFALFMNMMVPLAFFKGQIAPTTKRKLLWYAGLVVLVLGTVSSMSRGGFLGLLAPLVYCWWKTPQKIKTGFAAAIVGLILLIYMIPDSYWEEMQTITEEGTQKGTGSKRIYMWKRGWDMFLDHPLFGVGPGNIPHRFGYYEPPGGLNERSEAGRAMHSIYFTLMPELGLVGTFLFFGMIWVNLKERSRLRKIKDALYAKHAEGNEEFWAEMKNLEVLGWGLMGAMIAYLVSGIFLSVLYYGHFWLIMGFSVARNNLVRNLLNDAEKEVVVDAPYNPDIGLAHLPENLKGFS